MSQSPCHSTSTKLSAIVDNVAPVHAYSFLLLLAICTLAAIQTEQTWLFSNIHSTSIKSTSMHKEQDPWYILLIGDSQERRVVGHTCAEADHDPEFFNKTVAHFLKGSSTLVPLFPHTTTFTQRSWCCTLHPTGKHYFSQHYPRREIVLCNFFVYGIVQQDMLPWGWGELPLNFNERWPHIASIFSSLLRLDNNNNSTTVWDLISVHSGLWDILRLEQQNKSYAEQENNNNTYTEQDFLEEYAHSLMPMHRNISQSQPVRGGARVIWRTLPEDFSHRYQRRTTEAMNVILRQVGQEHSIPVNDWGHRMEGQSKLAQNNWHYNAEGSQRYMSGVLAYVECLEKSPTRDHCLSTLS